MAFEVDTKIMSTPPLQDQWCPIVPPTGYEGVEARSEKVCRTQSILLSCISSRESLEGPLREALDIQGAAPSNGREVPQSGHDVWE